MKILLPTAYFPPISWMALAIQAEQVMIEKHETFPKQTLRNRCNILTSNGLLTLSIPLSKTRVVRIKTKEASFCNDENWQIKHFRAITSAYNKSPFFYHYQHLIEDFYSKHFDTLIGLNQASIELVFKALKIKISLDYTSDWQIETGDFLDLRSFFPKAGIPVSLHMKSYLQVFSDRFQFQPDLSILDLLFNLGPETLSYLKSIDLQPIQDKQS